MVANRTLIRAALCTCFCLLGTQYAQAENVGTEVADAAAPDASSAPEASGVDSASGEVKNDKAPVTAAALPLLNFTTDRGVGYGLYGAVFFQGDSAGKSYSANRPPAPYSLSLGGQFYQTTGDYAYHKLLLDAPNLWNTGIRLNFTAGYETWKDAWYFGSGSPNIRLREGDTPARYYAFDSETYWGFGNARIPFSASGDLVVGTIFRNTRIGMYAPSLLEAEKPLGIEGGLLGILYGGVIWDFRDREPNTTTGFLSEITLRGALSGILSDYGFWGVNATHRHWFPLSRDKRLVLATRWILDVQGGEIPFFHAHVLGGSQWLEIGGHSALRGLPMGRHRGEMTALGTMEIRMRLFEWGFWSQKLAGMLVPFIEGGQVWNVSSEPFPNHVHGTFGGGFRLLYNEVFVVRFDYALGLERYAASSRNTDFSASEIDVNRAIYVIVGHPF